MTAWFVGVVLRAGAIAFLSWWTRRSVDVLEELGRCDSHRERWP
jgi:hypothetical protein